MRGWQARCVRLLGALLGCSRLLLSVRIATASIITAAC